MAVVVIVQSVVEIFRMILVVVLSHLLKHMDVDFPDWA
jgi:hypothetical protein